jgi:hypothetical protein
MVRNRPSNVRQIRFERMIEQAKNARTEFLREKIWLFWRNVKRTSSLLGITPANTHNGGFHAQIRL